MNQSEFNNLIGELLSYGEDKDELELWANIFQDLEPDEQDALVNNLQDELRQLKSKRN